MGDERDFEEKMSQLSDEELFDVLAHESDYIEEAIVAAKKELRTRDLSPEVKATLEAVSEDKLFEEEEKSNKPLPWIIRILMLIFAIGIPQIILAEVYRNRGFDRRAKECWVWMSYGIIFYIIILIFKILAI